MGEGRFEVEIKGEGSSEPDGESCEESPFLFDIFGREAHGQEEGECPINKSSESNGEHVGQGETVLGKMAASKSVDEFCGEAGRKQKRRPKNGRADGPVIVDVTVGREIFLTERGIREFGVRFVTFVPVEAEIQIVLEQ